MSCSARGGPVVPWCGGARWCRSCSGVLPVQVATHHPVHAVGRVALPRNRPLFDGPDTVAPRDSAPPRLRPPRPTWPEGGPQWPGGDLRTPRRTANGSRPRAPWARLTTIPARRRPVQTGFPCRPGPSSRGVHWGEHRVARTSSRRRPPVCGNRTHPTRGGEVSVPVSTVVPVRSRSRCRPGGDGGAVRLDSARELKARILALVRARPGALEAGAGARAPRVAVGLAPVGRGRAKVAVRLGDAADGALLPDLGAAARSEVDLRVIGPVLALGEPGPGALGHRTRPLRPGVSVAHPAVTAGTLGGFVRFGGRLALLSNNHVLAAGDAGAVGDPVLQPGPVDGGGPADRVATLAAFRRL